MRKLLFLTIFILFLTTNIVSANDEIIRTYKFDSDDINLTFVNDKLIEIDGNLLDNGEDGLPYKTIKIYYESNLVFIDFDVKENRQIINIDLKRKTETFTNAPYYKLKELKTNINFLGNFKKENRNFLLFKYYPVIYSKNEKGGIFLKEFEIVVRYKSKYIAYNNKNIIQNETYLIIGKKDIENEIKFFIDYKKSKGFNTIFKPVEDFIDNSGVKVNYKIRNYLVENYQKLNIKYLLLIGNENEIPPFKIYPYQDNNFVYSDFFYGELTSTLDLDKDKREGEPDDDKIDFYSEILVGRIPSSDIETVSKILSRSIDFEKLNDKNRVLLSGAIWNFEENLVTPLTDGAESLKIIFDETLGKSNFSNILLSEKDGVISSKYGIDKLNYDNFIKYINEYKPSLIFWQGHGFVDSTYRKIWYEDTNLNGYFDEGEDKFIKFVDRDTLKALNNEYPFIVFMGSCDNMKSFSNSLAYSFIKDYGVNVIAATDTAWYGIGWNSLSGGWLQSIMYKFSEFLSKEESVSMSLIESKEYYFENFIFPSQKYERYANIYVFNLFGDPSISLKKDKSYISTNSVTVKTNEIFKINFTLNIKAYNARGSIEFDSNFIKLLKIEGNDVNYSVVGDGKIFFKIDNIKESNLFSMLFFGKKEGETTILLKNINFNNNELMIDNYESNRIYIIKRRYPVWDINQDGVCFVEDFIEFSKAFGSYFGDSNYNSYCDFNMDGKIDGLDLIDFSIHFGESFKGG